MLDVQKSDTSVVLDERWLNGIGRAWVAFGTPAPSTKVEGSNGFLLNNGDGSYVSGVFTRETIPADDGVLIETTFSTPITMLQWQMISVSLQRDFRMPPTAEEITRGSVSGYTRELCSLHYPGGPEGKGYADSLRLVGTGESTALPATAEMRNGTIQKVSLGALPDGRCFALVNDALVWTAAEPINFNGHLRVMLSGNSKETTVRVGALRVTRGIPQRILDKLAPTTVLTSNVALAPR